MPGTLPQPHSKLSSLVAFGGALVLALGLFLIIPLTQALDSAAKETITYRQMLLAAPPPPPQMPPPSPRPILAPPGRSGRRPEIR